MSLNKVQLIGRLGQDPETRYTDSGDACCNFSLATSRKWKNKAGEKQEKTQWHNIVTWKGLAEVCGKYLSKGMQIFVEGELETNKWEKEGVTVSGTKVRCTNMIMLGDRRDSETNADPDRHLTKEAKANGVDIQTSAEFTADEIPF